MLDARVIHQHVDRAELRDGALEHRGDRRRPRHVGTVVGHGDAVSRSQPGGDALDLGALAEAVQHDVGAFAGQARRDAKPDAGGRAGDECGLSLEHR